MKYLRIGTDYYKLVNMPTISGGISKKLIKWTRSAILDDHNRDYLKNIERYEGFIVLPSHTNYEQVVSNFYNRYHRLNHILPSNYNEKKIENSLIFLEHIFGEQINIGLDYLRILYQKPLQILPILCLVSEERSTGKTTFLNWLKLIFEENMTINKNEDFRSRFNSDWSEKLIIGVDEVLLDKREDSERIKNLSTAITYKTESKGIDKKESPFFGKFILCSNNETNFILIDENEIRYWVRKVSVLDKIKPDFFKILKQELPYFVKFIATSPIVNKKITRMWFTSAQIKTKALKKLITGTKYQVEKELLLLLNDLFDDYDVTEIKFSFSDLLEQFKNSGQRISRRELSNVIVNKWKLEPTNSSYDIFFKVKSSHTNEWQVEKTNKKGRYFTFSNNKVKSMLNC